MVLKPLEWAARARADFKREADYYADAVSPHVSDEVAAAILAAADRIKKSPGGYRIGIKPATRECVLRDFPLTVIYRVGSRKITILRVMHQSRKYFNR